MLPPVTVHVAIWRKNPKPCPQGVRVVSNEEGKRGNGKGRNVCRLKVGWLLQVLSPGKAPQRPTKLGVLQGLAGKKDATQRYGLL